MRSITIDVSCAHDSERGIWKSDNFKTYDKNRTSRRSTMRKLEIVDKRVLLNGVQRDGAG